MLKLTEIPITPREFDVLQLLSQGMSNRAIGERLGICERTVKENLYRLYQRTGIYNHGCGARVLLAGAFSELSASMPILRAA